MRSIRDTLRARGVVLMRNNVGVARWDNGSRTRFGLGLGSADLVGLMPPSGRFVAVETKVTTDQSEEQKCWQRAVEAAGGLYVLARSVDDALRGVFGGDTP